MENPIKKRWIMIAVGVAGLAALGVWALLAGGNKAPAGQNLTAGISESEFDRLDALTEGEVWEGAQKMISELNRQPQTPGETLRVLLAEGDLALARSRRENKNYADRAVACYQKAVDLSVSQGGGQEPLFLFRLGTALMEKKNFHEAKTLFEKIILEFPRSPESFESQIQIGTCYRQSGAPEEAMAYFYRWMAREDNTESIDRIYKELVFLLESLDQPAEVRDL